MRHICIALLLICEISFSFAQNNLRFHDEMVSSKNAKKEAKKSCTLYYVYQESCSYCHDFTANLETLKKEKKWLQKNMTLIAKDGQNPKNAEFLRQYKIQTTPSIIWINHNTSETYIYQNAQDVHAFFMAILLSNKVKKYEKFFHQTYPKNYCEIDTFARSVNLHYLLAKDTLAAVNNMKNCQNTYIQKGLITEVFLENLAFTKANITEAEGQYLFNNIEHFSSFEYFPEHLETIREFTHRSLAVSKQKGDSVNYEKSIQLEYGLNFDKTDSTFLSRKAYFYMDNKKGEEVLKYILPLSKKYIENTELQARLSKDLHASAPEHMNTILLLAARAVLKDPSLENIQWYKYLLNHYGFKSEAEDIEP